jgi:hypothetical protein
MGGAGLENVAVVCAKARVVGVAFFDYKHGQTGVAPNAIELHPVLGFACLQGPGKSPPPPPPPSGTPCAASYPGDHRDEGGLRGHAASRVNACRTACTKRSRAPSSPTKKPRFRGFSKSG